MYALRPGRIRPAFALFAPSARWSQATQSAQIGRLSAPANLNVSGIKDAMRFLPTVDGHRSRYREAVQKMVEEKERYRQAIVSHVEPKNVLISRAPAPVEE